MEALCDRVSIIREGEIIESGTFSQLKHLTRTSITLGSFQPVNDLENMDGVHNLIDGNHTHFSVDVENMDSIVKHLTQFGIKSLISTPPTLEELFIRYYV